MKAEGGRRLRKALFFRGEIKLSLRALEAYLPKTREVFGEEELQKAQKEALKDAVRKKLRLPEEEVFDVTIEKRSLDARQRMEKGPFFVYQLVAFQGERPSFQYEVKRKKAPCFRPLVVGMGPAGLFAALILSRAGLCPLVIERGKPVEKRRADVEDYFKGGALRPESNVQFGEGGAGTFSDGKVNTLVKDPSRLGAYVLETFRRFGAPESILYESRPHIGTDRLQNVVRNLREELISLGAEVRFETKLSGLSIAKGRVTGAVLESTVTGEKETIEVQDIFLGIGHSARDTYEALVKAGVPMEKKAFAVGLRVEHPRLMIDKVQYHGAVSPFLGAASYKLTHTAAAADAALSFGRGAVSRGVYSFCMCPGGTVVAAASEKETIVTNGMSDYARSQPNSNSAVIVTVLPEDYEVWSRLCDEKASFEDRAAYRERAGDGGEDVLSGVRFQRLIERRAYLLGGANGAAPVQLLGSFLSEGPWKGEQSFQEVQPSYTGRTSQADLRDLYPAVITRALQEGFMAFGKKLSGFSREDAVLTGAESRSSSPVRVLRSRDSFQSEVKGLYPIGEGAGYAGGIMSAAMDGIRAAERYLSGLAE